MDLIIVALFVAFLMVAGVIAVRFGRELVRHFLARDPRRFEARVLDELEVLRLRLDAFSSRLDSMTLPNQKPGTPEFGESTPGRLSDEAGKGAG